MENPGFEKGEQPGSGGMPIGWESNDGRYHPGIHVLDARVRHSGRYSLHLKANPQWDLGMVRQVTNYGSIVPGRRYWIEAWVKTANVRNPAGWYVFGIAWFHDDTWVADVKMPRQEALNYDWRLIRYTAVAPVGANRVAVLLTRHTDGDAWYDDVSVSEVPTETRTAPTRNIIVRLTKWFSSLGVPAAQWGRSASSRPGMGTASRSTRESAE